MIKVRETEYFGLKVIVSKVDDITHPYPFRFEITDNWGVIHNYGGIPNYCETPRQALKRAWYRCKWMSEGLEKYELIYKKLS